MNTTQEVIFSALSDYEDLTLKAVLDFLEDGEALSKIGVNDSDEVDEAYAIAEKYFLDCTARPAEEDLKSDFVALMYGIAVQEENASVDSWTVQECLDAARA